MRRICLCALLCAVCLFFLFVPMAYADTVTIDGIVYEFRDGYACLAGFAQGAESITAHDMVSGYPVQYLANVVAEQNRTVTELVVGAEVTDLNRVFSFTDLLYMCPEVERIVFPAGLAQVGDILWGTGENLQAYVVAADNTAYRDIDGVLFSKDGKKMLAFPKGKGDKYDIPVGTVSIGREAFGYNDMLTRLTVPEGVTQLEDGALLGLRELREISLPASLKTVGEWLFPYSGALEQITVAEGSLHYQSIDGVLFSKDGKTLAAFPSGRSGYYDIPPGTTAIKPGAFGSNSFLSGITVPEGVTELLDGTFSSLGGLTQLYLPASLQSIGGSALPAYGAFEQIVVAEGSKHFQTYEGVLFSRDGKTLLTYPAGRKGAYEIPPGTLHIAAHAFGDNDGLTGITVPDGVTKLVEHLFSDLGGLEEVCLPASLREIGDGALPDFGALRRVEVAEGNPRYQSIDGVLFDGDELIFYPSMHGLSYDVPPGTKRIRHRAFAECDMLQTITIPRGITEIGDEVFYNCTALERVSLPITLTKIGVGAFGNCIALSGITLPPGLEILDDYAFDNCSSLAYMQIPDGVKELGNSVFLRHSPDFVLYAAKGSAGYWHAWEMDILWAEPGGVPKKVKPTNRQTQSAVVNNASNQDLLNLLAKPKKGAKSLGKYANGTTVQVLETIGDWAHVQLYGAQGYMPLESLMFTDKYNNLVRITWGRKRQDMREPLRLYAEPSEDAPSEVVKDDVSMRILDTVGVWYHVQILGREGYVPVQNLNVAPNGIQNRDCYVVANPNAQDRLHLRQEPSLKSKSLGRYFNGTQVEAIGEYHRDGWIKVRVEGKAGYMMIQYLLHIYWSDEDIWLHG